MTWALKIPITTTEPDCYDLRGLARDLLAKALQNIGSNNVVVPVLQAFNVLLEADVFEKLPQNPEGLKTYVGATFMRLFAEFLSPQVTLSTATGDEECPTTEEPAADQYVHEMVSGILVVRTVWMDAHGYIFQSHQPAPGI